MNWQGDPSPLSVHIYTTLIFSEQGMGLYGIHYIFFNKLS